MKQTSKNPDFLRCNGTVSRKCFGEMHCCWVIVGIWNSWAAKVTITESFVASINVWIYSVKIFLFWEYFLKLFMHSDPKFIRSKHRMLVEEEMEREWEWERERWYTTHQCIIHRWTVDICWKCAQLYYIFQNTAMVFVILVRTDAQKCSHRYKNKKFSISQIPVFVRLQFLYI